MNIKFETVELIYVDVIKRHHLKDNTYFPSKIEFYRNHDWKPNIPKHWIWIQNSN